MIAEVSGVATAAGCQLVASCDLAYAGPLAKFATPGVNIGLFCSTPMVALSRNISNKHSMEMLLTGDLISSDKAAKIGLINTSIGVIIVYVAMNVPFTIWLTDGFFRQIPKEMSEVARTDGCTRLQAFWNVELPLAGPGIGAAAIFAFLLSWNEYALASILTRTVHSKTLPIGMMDYLDEFTINWAGMCAIAVVMIVPAIILTFIVQKHLVSGLTFGGVKG